MQQVSRDAKTFFSQYVKIAAEVAAIQQLALCTTLGSIVVYTSVIYINLVTFFVKISEIAMTKLTCIHFLLVESLIFHLDIGST